MKIIGREKQKLQLLKFLTSYKEGYVAPCIAVYGSSGSGKSVVVQNILENLEDLSYAVADLRQANTVFGATNVILSQLGEPNVRSAQGLQQAVNAITNSIETRLQKESKKVFVLVLDEFDAIFRDTRSSASDFVFRMICMNDSLKQKGYLFCIITVSNNAMTQYELDVRVRSRMGNAEIFFEPYNESDVMDILRQRSDEALAQPASPEVLEYCSMLSSMDHGDARQAIDLLRVGAEIAGEEGRMLTKRHVDDAAQKIEHDRAESVLSNLTYHSKIACISLAKLTYVSQQGWHATSEIFEEYGYLVENVEPQHYRSVSSNLRNLVDSGIATSYKSSKGRQGFGTEYKLEMDPDMVGRLVDKEMWSKILLEDAEEKEIIAQFNTSTRRGKRNAERYLKFKKIMREHNKITEKREKLERENAELQKEKARLEKIFKKKTESG